MKKEKLEQLRELLQTVDFGMPVPEFDEGVTTEYGLRAVHCPFCGIAHEGDPHSESCGGKRVSRALEEAQELVRQLLGEV